MILPRLALRGLARTPRSSLTLVALVAAGVLVFTLGDAGLGAAASGIRTEFQDGYTGDIVVRASFERKFGIFGFSIPAIGEYEEMPTLTEAPAIEKLLASIHGVQSLAGLVSGAALLQGPRGYQVKVPVFGVQAQEYFPLFPALRFVEGALPNLGEAWIILPTSRADDIQRAEGRRPEIGDSLQFTMASGNAFTIRAVRLAGIVETPIREDSAYAAVYTDPGTLRALLGLSLGNAGTKPKVANAEALDVDSFFSSPDAGIQSAGQEGPRGLELLSSSLASSTPAASSTVDPSNGAWHFVLARLERDDSISVALRRINFELSKAGIRAEAVGWLPVAGLNASILYLLKTVFEIGIGILAGIVILVLANGLAYSVIEQTREIGTMRAIGAQKSFVRRLFLLQTSTLVLVGAFAGLGLAAVAIDLVGRTGIRISNSYLFMLFGTHLLKPVFHTGTAFIVFGGAAVVAGVSSIYPIYLAMRVSEAQTMSQE